MGLSAELRELDDAALTRLFEVRDDLLARPPLTFDRLAAAASQWGSQLRCLSRLDQFSHQLLELVALVPTPVTPDAVAELAGPGATLAQVEAGLARLAELALVTVDGRLVKLVGELPRALSGAAGLGRPAAALLGLRTVEELRHVAGALEVVVGTAKKADLLRMVTDVFADAGRVQQLLAGAPPEVAVLLERMAANATASVAISGSMAMGGYSGRPHSGSSAVDWLAERGMLVHAQWGVAELVREVGLAHRGGFAFPDLRAEPPPLLSIPHGTGVDADVEAGHVAARLVDRLARLVDDLGSTPAPVLKTGGVGVRVVKRLAAVTETDERDAAALVELAVAVGLVQRSDPLRATPLFDEWVQLDQADRWLHVLRRWLSAPAHLRAAGARDANDKFIAPLSAATGGRDAPRMRLTLLQVLAEGPAGHAVDDWALVQRAWWLAPRLWAEVPATDTARAIEWFAEEAALVGAMALGSLSAAVRCELAGDGAGARIAAIAGMPAAESRFVVQADLTALALGPLDAPVALELGLMADVESRGSASTYRFSAASVGRALNAGRTAAEVLTFLSEHSTTGVPQPLRYLVDDVGRRYGHARVGTAVSYVTVDDPALLAEMVRSKKLAKLALREIAPTVAVCAQPLAILLGSLRAAGYLPVDDAASPGVAVSRPKVASPGRPPSPGRPEGSPGPASQAASTPASMPASRPASIAAERITRAINDLRTPAPAASAASAAPNSVTARFRTPGSRIPPSLLDRLDEILGAQPASSHRQERGTVAMLRHACERGIEVLIVFDDAGDDVMCGVPVELDGSDVTIACSDCGGDHVLEFDEIEGVELQGRPTRRPNRSRGKR